VFTPKIREQAKLAVSRASGCEVSSAALEEGKGKNRGERDERLALAGD